MLVTKCDVCKKAIKKNTKSVHIGIGGFFGSNRVEMCEKCGESIFKILEDKKLVKEK